MTRIYAVQSDEDADFSPHIDTFQSRRRSTASGLASDKEASSKSRIGCSVYVAPPIGR